MSKITDPRVSYPDVSVTLDGLTLTIGKNLRPLGTSGVKVSLGDEGDDYSVVLPLESLNKLVLKINDLQKAETKEKNN